MLKKTTFFIAFFYACFIMAQGISHGAADRAEARRKAAIHHERANEDVIFIDEEQKANYYQNLQIISLLEDLTEYMSELLTSMEALRKQVQSLDAKVEELKEEEAQDL